MKNLLFSLAIMMGVSAAALAESSHQEPVMVTVSQSQHLPADAKKHKPGPARSTSAFAPQKVDQHNTVSNQDFWIYDCWLTLLTDEDYDGYFASFSLSFDADTFYQAHELYAVIYLGDAVEYKSVYVTSVFTVYGEDSDDYVTLDIELVSGYAPYDYDIRIELFDAHNDYRVAVYDAFNDADLSLVSLESRSNDQPYHDSHHSSSRHGGSIGLAGILMFIFAIARRCTKLRL
ncbi:choice-of-anchor H family protein [Salinimonas iocasae]|uniref:GlyGly-CTERM sorting domain-containing protein n=1 Tax=Salinimonas iocasae TaxID=2572577 RepID=A0A5B7YDI3_9ALTE|nr:choice-of-anchor H family protein [Salinimonas iocasae]QCZ92659.1 hypothetical protein FBQ74_03860 [Salinimonas iocasae]